VLARSSPDDKHALVARLNGSLPDSEADWLKAHPGRSWEKERDKLLPGACVRACMRACMRAYGSCVR